MNSPGYNFNVQDYPFISVHLLIEVLAYQHALTDALMDELKDEVKAKRIVERIKELMPEKKESILEQVYASFGQTPEV